MKRLNKILTVHFQKVKRLSGKSIDTLWIQTICVVNTSDNTCIHNHVVILNHQLIVVSPKEVKELFHGSYNECCDYCDKYIENNE